MMSMACPICGTCQPLIDRRRQWRLLQCSATTLRGRVQALEGNAWFDVHFERHSFLGAGSIVGARIAVCRVSGRRAMLRVRTAGKRESDSLRVFHSNLADQVCSADCHADAQHSGQAPEHGWHQGIIQSEHAEHTAKHTKTMHQQETRSASNAKYKTKGSENNSSPSIKPSVKSEEFLVPSTRTWDGGNTELIIDGLAVPSQHVITPTSPSDNNNNSNNKELGAGRLAESFSESLQATSTSTQLAEAGLATSMQKKALKSLNCATAKWSNADWSEREAYVHAVAAQLSDAEATYCWQQLLSVLRNAAAALSPPRCKATSCDSGEQMTENAQFCLDAAARQQQRLRLFFIRALALLRQFEEDERVEVILRHVQRLIEHFEQRAGDIYGAAGGRQWSLIQAALVDEQQSSGSQQRQQQQQQQQLVGQLEHADEQHEQRSHLKRHLENGDNSPNRRAGILKKSKNQAVPAHSSTLTPQPAPESRIGQLQLQQQRQKQVSHKLPKDVCDQNSHRTKQAWSEIDRGRLTAAAQVAGGKDRKLQASDWKRIGQDFGRSADSVLKQWLKMTDARYSFEKTPVRHARGAIKNMAIEAMARLGGQATIPELISFCRADAVIQASYGEKLSEHLTKISGAMQLMPLWERSLSTNMSGVFQATGRKREGRKVYAFSQQGGDG
ncbi:unnamed protein product [Polarella glacialis]|uniref:Uncharacterized protein n=1 Tax=Polarella glacialis TaxID=89957 RepID=A0A813H133_POLGL|nr:unnamed protein product [Polarella glacialis]